MEISTSAFDRIVEAKPHSAVYMMHKYFARRPWNVFREIISHYTRPSDIILDPFCGGGVTVVESLKLRRKPIAVDVNPLATYVTRMEVSPVDLDALKLTFGEVRKKVEREILRLYATKCPRCKAITTAEWIEWEEKSGRIMRLNYQCNTCSSTGEKKPAIEDEELAERVSKAFSKDVRERNLWYPDVSIPDGDKTKSLLNAGIKYFHELFTRRNLLALAILRDAIQQVENPTTRQFLELVFSSSLKWASRQSHMRSKIIEGWAMHAYWIYPKSLEINVWKTFERRFEAVCRGKRYSNQEIGNCKFAHSFTDLKQNADCLILTRSSANLPIPDSSIDAVITDPPYGGNVNYSELSDYWVIWRDKGQTIDKKDEVIINRTQGKNLTAYERLLLGVLKECYRVLKPARCLVSTFNSKDLRVVASFVMAASEAGFSLHPDGLVYQPPIRAYTTTFHAMQVGAFVGDFVFTFVKSPSVKANGTLVSKELDKFKVDITRLIEENINGSVTEPQLREKAYRMLIPFLSKYAPIDEPSCREAVDFFESEIEKYEGHFKNLHDQIIEKRREVYLSSKNGKRSRISHHQTLLG